MIFIFLLCDNCLSFDRVQLLLLFTKKQELINQSEKPLTIVNGTGHRKKKVYKWANKYMKNSNSFLNQ